MKYYRIGESVKIICRTPQALKNWAKGNVLKPHHVVVENGYSYYSQELVELDD